MNMTMQYNKELLKEKKRVRDKAYREANKDKISDYREANKDKMHEYSKAYYEANKEKKSKYSKAYREANKEKLEAKFACECGRTTSIHNKQKHFRTGRHKAFTYHGIDYIEMFDMNLKIWYTCWQMKNNLNEWINLSNDYDSHIYPFTSTVKRHFFDEPHS